MAVTAQQVKALREKTQAGEEDREETEHERTDHDNTRAQFFFCALAALLWDHSIQEAPHAMAFRSS